MPYFMDRHELSGATAVDVAGAHLQDLTVQDRFGVKYVNYWFDYDRQTAFCLAHGPDRNAIESVHRAAHGLMAHSVVEVDSSVVERFMGGIIEHSPGEPYVDTAFRAVLFTDLADSTALTQRLGDAAAMAVLRRHDTVVRESLARTGGSEVKHTGDGVMASFASAAGAVRSAIRIQQRLAEASPDVLEPVVVRIGISAGEPVEESGDLFGAAVQLAARLCGKASPRGVLVSSAVRDLALGKGFVFRKRTAFRLKGFDEPVRAFEVVWDGEGSSPPQPASTTSPPA